MRRTLTCLLAVATLTLAAGCGPDGKAEAQRPGFVSATDGLPSPEPTASATPDVAPSPTAAVSPKPAKSPTAKPTKSPTAVSCPQGSTRKRSSRRWPRSAATAR
ncbi:hypothetical protein ACFQY4_43625 [Catellatospora bangladeshensis]|uniref:hypothetical protein n=1 Tax=Catellatospora bangladeshensis TaxID=310355 RepID=UPI0036141FEE